MASPGAGEAHRIWRVEISAGFQGRVESCLARLEPGQISVLRDGRIGPDLTLLRAAPTVAANRKGAGGGRMIFGLGSAPDWARSEPCLASAFRFA